MIFHDSEDNLLTVFLCKVKAVRPFSCSALFVGFLRSSSIFMFFFVVFQPGWQGYSVLSDQYSVQYSVRVIQLSTQSSVFNAQYSFSTQCSVLSFPYSVLGAQYSVPSAKYPVLDTQCSVLSTQYVVV